MCFDATTSILAFTICLVCSIYLLWNGATTRNKYDLFFSAPVILIGLMQLNEYFLWKNQTCGWMNHAWSLVIIVVLALQPIVCSIAYTYLFKGGLGHSVGYICGLYALFTIYFLSVLNQHSLCSRPSKHGCRLVWAPLEQKDPFTALLFQIFIAVYFLLLVYSFGVFDTNRVIQDGYRKYPIRYILLPLSVIIGVWYSYYTNGKKWRDVFGTVWCFVGVALGIISCLHI